MQNIMEFFTRPFDPSVTKEEPDYNKNIDSLIRDNTPTEQGLLGYTEPYIKAKSGMQGLGYDGMDPRQPNPYTTLPPEQLGPVMDIPYGPQEQIPGQGLPLLGVGGRKPFSRLGDIISKWWNRGNNEGPEFLGNAPMDKVNEQLGEPPVY